MLQLSAGNALDYLHAAGRIQGGARVEELSGGVSNLVLRVDPEEGVGEPFVVKQSRPQLRTKDAWYSDLDRVYREQEVMQALAPFLPDIVPRVLFTDRANFLFAMSAAPRDAPVWKRQLLDGQVDAAFGVKVGNVLG